MIMSLSNNMYLQDRQLLPTDGWKPFILENRIYFKGDSAKHSVPQVFDMIYEPQWITEIIEKEEKMKTGAMELRANMKPHDVELW